MRYNACMTRKILAFIIVVGVVVVGYWLISPLFIEHTVNEQLEDIPAVRDVPDSTLAMPGPMTLLSGHFVGQGAHNGEGTATLLEIDGKYYVRFEDNFQVTNGPDLFVHLGRDGEYVAEARLGALKGNVGGQNYEVPEGLDISSFNEVWVWCRAFSVPFARAELI